MVNRNPMYTLRGNQAKINIQRLEVENLNTAMFMKEQNGKVVHILS